MKCPRNIGKTDIAGPIFPQTEESGQVCAVGIRLPLAWKTGSHGLPFAL